LLLQSSESLAGRLSYLEIGTFQLLEMLPMEHDLRHLWLRGGFPGSNLAADDAVSYRWRNDFIRT